MKYLIYFILFFGFATNIKSKDFFQESFISNTDSSDNYISYSMSDSILDKLPFKNLNSFSRFYPGVVSYFQDFYIRGGESYETGFFIDGDKFNDLFTGKNSFFINPNAFEKIDFYNGFIPNEFGNVSSGLFNYKLRTGGDKISFEAEHLSDNITFTSNPYSGKKRLGAYFYGYNETNLSLGGPLFFNNLRFFTNINYLFQRDKNPQRYPGIDAVFDNGKLGGESIFIKMPAGIVPLNSFENIALVSKLDFDFDEILISAYGIYFDENSFVERNHILEYLNPRAGLIDKNGGIINLKLDHQMNEALSYSVNANYYSKSEVTTDQYLGENYWSYGDSVANAEAGVIWQRQDSYNGRYRLLQDKNIMLWTIRNFGYPGINHQKSEQERISLNGNLKLNLYNHLIRIGGEFSFHTLRLWQMPAQRNLAQRFALLREDPQFQEYTDKELKEYIAKFWGVNNLGYNYVGEISNTGFDKAPEPFFYSIFLDDQFNIFDNFSFYLGLRYDNFNFDYMKMTDPASPEKTFIFNTFEINEEGLIATKNYSILSPKIYLKFSPLDYLSFTANYSQNVQSYPFSEFYSAIHLSGSYSDSFGYIVPRSFRTGDIKPIISSGFELGLFYKAFTNFNTSLIYYNKKTKNYFSLDHQRTNTNSPFISYYFYDFNGDMNTEGLQLLWDYYFSGLTIRSTLNYQNAEETTYKTPDNPFANLYNVIKNYLEPEQSNGFYFNLLLNYNFSSLNELSNIFSGLNLSTMFHFNDGHPFRLERRFNYYPFQQIPERTPTVFQADLKIEKKLNLFNQLDFSIYIYVINLFDTKNIYDLFPTTGSVENDGHDIDGYVQNLGEQLFELHKLLNFYNPDGGQQTFYGPPRQIGFGVKLNY